MAADLPYFELVIGFILTSYAFETYLDTRQYRAHKRTSLPPELEGVVSPLKFAKARAYSLDKSHLHFVHSFVGLVEALSMLVLLPRFWKVTSLDFKFWVLNGRNEIEHSIIYLLTGSLFSQVLELPFSLYSTFVVESRHGFNKQTVWGFFKDLLISQLISLVLTPPLVAAIIAIIQNGGPNLVLYLWLFTLSLSLFFMALYPVLIAPLFNKYTPLEDGSLRTKIEELAASLKFPLKKLFVVDGSTRSSHSNAYLYGFFNNKRIVLYDTLIHQCGEDEVVAVIAHELGHWKLRHTVKSFLASQVLIVVQFAGFAYIRSSPEIYKSFGFESEQPIIIGFILFQHIITPLSHVISFFFNMLSRAFEFQADEFAVKLGFVTELKAGLVKLQEENLSAMNTDPWYSTYHYSHPPLVERLKGLDSSASKKKTE